VRWSPSRTSIACLVLVGLAVPACSLDKNEDAGLSEKPPSADAAAKPGGELRVGIVRPSTLDPQLIHPADSAAALVVRTMCDPLIGADPESRELRPALVKTWRVLGEGKSVQIELRAKLKFSDGSELTARDVAAAFERVVDPSTASPAADLVRHIIGWKEMRDDENDYLAGVDAISGDTVQIGLDRGDAQWVSALTLPLAIPVPRGASRRAGFSAQPVCVGPYKLAGPYTGKESEIRLVRNPEYEGNRPSLTRAGQGWADSVVFKIYASRSAALTAMRLGAVDATQVAGKDLPLKGVPGAKVLSVPTGRLEYIGLPRVEPFDQPIVKALLSAVLDRKRLNDVAFRSTRVPESNLLPITLPDSLLPEARGRTCGLEGRSLTAAQIREALTETKLDLSKVKAPFYYNDEFDNAAMVTEIARQWKAALGLTLTPKKVSFDQLVARGKSATGFDGLFRMTATAEFPDVGEFVLPLIDRESFGTTNITGYDGQLLSRRLEQDAMIATDPAEQRQQYFSIALGLCTVPMVPVAWYQSHLAVSSKVVVAANGGVDRMAGVPELRELAVR
jgi:ABC-type transport system substrate-binding protein